MSEVFQEQVQKSWGCQQMTYGNKNWGELIKLDLQILHIQITWHAFIYESISTSCQ